MIPLVIPKEDANSDSALLTEWLVADGAPVSREQPVCEVETSKIVFEVVAPADGWLVHGAAAGDEVRFNAPVALIVTSADEVAAARQRLTTPALVSGPAADPNGFVGKLTERARQLVEKHHIAPSRLPDKPLITERDVLALLDDGSDFFSPLDQRPAPLDPVAVRTARTAVLGAGLGAMQVVDILAHDPRVQVVGYFDDNAELHGNTIYGLPVVGPSALVEEWFRAGRLDAAIIAVSTSNALRRRWYEWLKRLGVPLVNAIDPTATINRGAVIGEGNVICAHAHLGVETRIGNNNFLSAHISIDHHNLWGSHITTGPGVMTSGCVQVEDDVKMGTGIFIQPHVTIGQGALIASGAILTRSVPARHAVKTRVQTVITPLQQGNPHAAQAAHRQGEEA